MAIILIINLTSPAPKVFTKPDSKQSDNPNSTKNNKLPASSPTDTPIHAPNNRLVDRSSIKPPSLNPFDPLPQGVPLNGYILRIAGSYGLPPYDFLINASNSFSEYNLRRQDLTALGFTFSASSPCLVNLQYKGLTFIVTCHKNTHSLQIASTNPLTQPAR
jgi:hypothetical protein